MKRFKTILVPLDFSETADEALRCGVALAREAKGRLLVLHAMPPYQPWSIEQPLWIPDPAAERRLQKELAAHVGRIAGRSGVRCKSEAVWGDPGQAIVDFARDRGCDLIVIGTHGRTGWNRLLIGSVAEKVVRHAPCPVLTVRPPAKPRRRAPAKPRKRPRAAASKARR